MISLRSKVTRAVLNYYFLNPQRRLYLNEISRKLGLDKRNLAKKIGELEEAGLLLTQKSGNQKSIFLNEKYPLLREYQRIAAQSFGLKQRLKQLFEKIPGVKEVYIFGSFARDEMDAHSDIDLLVVGDHSLVRLQPGVSRLRKELDREFNVINMDRREFRRRLREKDAFLLGILNKKHIKLFS
jgi:predicted nucleotidyltransferase/predicted transcriptional regulator with HTH domain